MTIRIPRREFIVALVDIGSADHFTNCLCVARIVLLALDVLSRRHQTHSMAERLGAVSSKVCRDSRGRACGPPPESPLSPARRAAIPDSVPRLSRPLAP
jgi:hypothetical protein